MKLQDYMGKPTGETGGGIETGGGKGTGGSSKRTKLEVVDIQSITEQKEAQEALFSSLASNLINSEALQLRLKTQQDATKLSTDNFLEGIATSPEYFAAMQLGIEALKNELKEIEEQEQRFASMMEAAKAAGDAIQSYAKQGGDSLKELGKTALKAAADFVRAEMMKATAAYIANALAKLGFLGLVVAGAGAAVVGTLFTKALKGLKVPALAKGGLAHAPTLAMVGDNPNAGVDPEVIAPLSKLKSMIGGMGGGMGNMVMTHRIAGNDLLMILKSANMNEQRTTGTAAFATG